MFLVDLLILLIILLLVTGLIRPFRREKKSRSIVFVSEQQLFVELRKHYKDIISQQRFPWLGRQSLDMYIPSKKVAIEYQGEQHFKPVSMFGGSESYKKQRALDKKKKKLCRKNGVKLFYFSFSPKAPNRLYGKKVYKNVEKLRKRLKWTWLY